MTRQFGSEIAALVVRLMLHFAIRRKGELASVSDPAKSRLIHHPAGGRVLQGADAEDGESVFEPARATVEAADSRRPENKERPQVVVSPAAVRFLLPQFAIR